MADDLIIKYFQANLTDSEEEALAEKLRTSTEEALRFGQHAEAAYRHYGLPEPQWPGPSSSGFNVPKIGSWLFLAILAGGLIWEGTILFKGPPPAISTADASPTSPQEKVPVPSRKSGVIAEGPDLPIGPERTVPEAAPQAPPVVQAPSSIHDPHSNLAVVVHRKSPARVLVQVLGPDAQPVTCLFQGVLGQGVWTFDWNGLGRDGQGAAPGTYRIEVVSGAVTQIKNIVIHKK